METRKREPTLHSRGGTQEVPWDARMASVVPVRCGQFLLFTDTRLAAWESGEQ